MKWGLIFSLLFLIIVIVLLTLYWFFPVKPIKFEFGKINNNFSIGNSSSMQFYPNMRYSSKNISYKIYDCNLKKKNDMEEAFNILSQNTVLDFYLVSEEEEISITCDEKTKMEEGLFIAGEGGPTNIISTDLYNVILNGKILLIRDSSCYNPNVAIHELLHALGFDHSENKKNIMYYLSDCDQTIGQDQIDLINELYKTQSYADLSFTNVSATYKKGYLDTIIQIKNNGLKDSEKAELSVFVDDKLIETVDLNPIVIGAGLKITLGKRVSLLRTSASELKFVIDSYFEEINKNNNEIVLEVFE